MWFVGNQTSGSGARLYAADSPTPFGKFIVRNHFGSAEASAYGSLDPDIWQDALGNLWLLWSQQNGLNTAANKIFSALLNPNGISFAENFSHIIATYSSVNSFIPSPINRGGNPQIENPALVTDPLGTYRFGLTMSFGSYRDLDTYRTVNAGCESPAGPCGSTNEQMVGFNTKVVGSSGVKNAGGASFVRSSSEWSEAFMPFAAVPSTSSLPLNRRLYFDRTNSGLLRGTNEYISAGNPNQGINYCMCTPNGWRLYMQTDGNLVIYDQNNVARWASNTSGGLGSYAMMQTDGNFVVYDNGVKKFASNTAGNPGAYLRFQNSDGNLVIYTAAGQPIWATGT